MKNIFFSCILLICSFFIISCNREGQKEKTAGSKTGQNETTAVAVAAVGHSAPDFTLKDVLGRTWTLSELKGQVVFVNFWATWCPPCISEMPSMQNLYETLPNDQFKMLAVLNRDKPANADKFIEDFGIFIPILYDQDNTVGAKYGLTGVPETFIVDKQGIIREKIIGPAEWDSPGAMQMLRQYLNQ
ncbi:MAG: peroxiredoxin family protein [Candidatus Electrothrix sp. YB6]